MFCDLSKDGAIPWNHVQTCLIIANDNAILKFLFGSLKWLSKDGAIPFESYSVLFDSFGTLAKDGAI